MSRIAINSSRRGYQNVGIRRNIVLAQRVMVSLAAALLLGVTGVHSAWAERTTIRLSENWYVRQLDTDQPGMAAVTREAAQPDGAWLAAKMPAQVHDVLRQHGKISDPRVGKNAAECAWVGGKDWAYVCRFPSPKETGGPVFLRFDGLDTLAEAYLNGRHIGSFDNMYRTYAVDVTDKLARENEHNVLLIVFSSPLRFVSQVEPPEDMEGVSKAHFVTKCHSDFGSYLGARPHSAKVGIFRDVYLDVPERSWIQDVWVRPKLSGDSKRGTIHIRSVLSGKTASVELLLHDPAGTEGLPMPP